MNGKLTDSIVSSRKQYRRNKVLDIIRKNPGVSRHDIKKITAYSMETVLGIIDELIGEGLIYEEFRSDFRIGRRPVSLFIDPKGGYFVGIEFSAQRVQGILLNFAKEQVHTQTLAVNAADNAESLLEKVITLIQRMLDSCPKDGKKAQGVGIGLPGFFDPKTGVSLSYDFLPFWKNIPIKKIIEEHFSLPCFVENNAVVIAMAYKAMAGKSTEDFLFVSVRTGIRIVMCYGGRFIFEGKSYAGQLGHVKIPGSNRLCSCGERGCLNAETADPGIRNKMIEMMLHRRLPGIFESLNGNLENVDIELLKDAVVKGDPDAIELIRDSALKLGHCLGIAVDILAPECIVLSGKLIGAGNLFMNAVEQGIRQNTINGSGSAIRLVSSALEDNAGAWGAAVLAMFRLYDFETLQI